jgi:hypothetical protein
VSAYGFTLASLTQVDASDLPGWLARAERDLRPDGLVRGRETDAVLLLTANVAGRSVGLTVYKQHGRVRLEAQGADPRALERYLCDQLELTVASQVERTLPGAAAARLQDNDRQHALMELFRAAGQKRVRGSGSSDGWSVDTWFGGLDSSL